ncbi:hypothetical protein GY45DRAFT_423602 [Cubamyces sp. BRFM 1775]|nr:hypothetical protein GY45DRAFT_423602 [Cubamyces sp. BRFM 1775]
MSGCVEARANNCQLRARSMRLFTSLCIALRLPRNCYSDRLPPLRVRSAAQAHNSTSMTRLGHGPLEAGSEARSPRAAHKAWKMNAVAMP